MRWRAASLALGTALLAAGCWFPLVRLLGGRPEPPNPRPPAWDYVERWFQGLEVSVIDDAFPAAAPETVQVHDTYLVAEERRASWAARLLLAAAVAAVVVVAVRRRPWPYVACGALALSIVWLYVEVRPPPPKAAGWTLYPSLGSQPPLALAVESWAALAAGTALLALAARPPAPEAPS